MASDTFATATTLDLSAASPVLASNVGATTEAGEPDPSGGPAVASVWWVLTPASSGTVTLTTEGSTFDTILGVYTGTTVSALTEVASDDDSGPGSTSLLSFAATAGATYHVLVGGYADGDEGDIVLGFAFEGERVLPASIPSRSHVPGPRSPYVRPGSISSASRIPGPLNLNTSLESPYINPASMASRARVRGPQAPAIPSLLGPIRPAGISSRAFVPGPWLPPLIPELPPPDPAFLGDLGITIVGYPEVTTATVVPAKNEIGTATFTCTQPGPAVSEEIGVNVLGRRVFTGLANQITDVQVDQGDYAGQLVTVQLDGMLSEWDQARVLPDFGARHTPYLGAPLQDTRTMDWHMDRIGAPGNDILPPLNFSRSQALDMRASDLYGLFPLPDSWPSPGARWMWATDPSVPAPVGNCYFRANTSGNPPAGKYQIWGCAHDYAEIWIDGVQVLTCDTPGVAQHVEIDMVKRPHLITIRAYNQAGRAGVAFSMVRVIGSHGDPDRRVAHDEPSRNPEIAGFGPGFYDIPVVTSAAGWRCLAYPTTSLRLSPGAVIKQLRYETRKRTAVGNWEFTFDQFRDSAGRRWPAGELISLKVGDSYLDVLRQLAEDRVDFLASPSRRRLSMWVKDLGTGVNVATPWTYGADLDSQVETRTAR